MCFRYGHGFQRAVLVRPHLLTLVSHVNQSTATATFCCFTGRENSKLRARVVQKEKKNYSPRPLDRGESRSSLCWHSARHRDTGPFIGTMSKQFFHQGKVSTYRIISFSQLPIVNKPFFSLSFYPFGGSKGQPTVREIDDP